MFENLKVRPGQVIRSSWANDLVDAIQTVAEYGAVDYYGYVHDDLIPERDLVLNLGLEDLRFNEVHAGEGHFSYDLTLQGKRVLKDEDPIYIAAFFAYAKAQVEDAIVNAMNELGIPPKPHRVGVVVNYYAPAMADVFSPDLVMNYDGKVRFKFSGYEDCIAYVKHIPYGLAQEIVAALNSTMPIEKQSWAEFDFTVNQNDKVNVKVFPSTTVTVIVYNIPEA